MDELTVERFGPGIPYPEARRKPRALKLKTPQSVIDARREVLCGTSDMALMELRAGKLDEHRRLVEVIRRAS